MELRRDAPQIPDGFDQDIAPKATDRDLREAGRKVRPGGADKDLYDRLPALGDDEIEQIPLLRDGVPMEQGSVYLDLDHLDEGPWVAVGSDPVRPGQRIVAKRDLDYDTWNRLAGDRPERHPRP